MRHALIWARDNERTRVVLTSRGRHVLKSSNLSTSELAATQNQTVHRDNLDDPMCTR
jgi:hypothetical protein